MKKAIALALVIIICSLSMVSCSTAYVFSLVHQLTDKTPGYFTYTEFTEEEKALFTTHIGYVPPFIPSDKYTVSSFYDDGNFEEGIRYSSLYNTAENFQAFLDRLSALNYSRTETDDYGDRWYYFTRGDIVIATAFYETVTFNVIDVFVYIDETEAKVERGYLTNDGKGLPEGTGGIYKADFTKSEHVDNVTDLHNFTSGCPTVGSAAVLVIPVQFSDATAASRGYSINTIKTAFTGDSGSTSYYSVEEYYYISSYGALDLDVTVLDEWFTPKHPSSYYKNRLNDGENVGDQMIMNEALDYLEEKMDLTKFDSDGNGYLDAVIMINTLTVDDNNFFTWAFRYWSTLTDEEGYAPSYDGVKANDYAWMSYGFMHETTDRWGRPVYTAKHIINTKTYIHEFGHILGAEDYYDTSYEDPTGPLHGKDMMDDSVGDHNPYTKFNLGWLTASRLVTSKDSITLTLEDFSKNGDTLIIADNFDPALGAYQEYYVLAYYSPTGLNNSSKKYFDREGIVIYHVNSSLYYEKHGDDSFYTLGYNNDSGEAEKSHLIELTGISFGSFELPYYIFTEGMTINGIGKDGMPILPYTVTVNSLSQGKASLTFKKVQ